MCHRFEANRFQFRIQLRLPFTRPRWLALDDLQQQLCGRSWKGQFAGEHLIEHHAQTVHVRAPIDLLHLRLLRRHVGRRTHDFAQGSEIFLRARSDQIQHSVGQKPESSLIDCAPLSLDPMERQEEMGRALKVAYSRHSSS